MCGYVSTHTHAHMCTYEHVFACRSMHARVEAHVYEWVNVCANVCMRVYVCMCKGVQGYWCVYMSTCICVTVHVWECVRVCVHSYCRQDLRDLQTIKGMLTFT